MINAVKNRFKAAGVTYPEFKGEITPINYIDKNGYEILTCYYPRLDYIEIIDKI